MGTDWEQILLNKKSMNNYLEIINYNKYSLYVYNYKL